MLRIRSKVKVDLTTVMGHTMREIGTREDSMVRVNLGTKTVKFTKEDTNMER